MDFLTPINSSYLFFILQCPFCEKRYLQAYNLRTHIRQRHPEENNYYDDVDLCKQSSTSSNSKVTSSTAELPLAVMNRNSSECNPISEKRDNNQMHSMNKDLEQGSRSGNSKVIDKVTTSATDLPLAVKIGDDCRKIIECLICGKSLEDQETLKRHYDSHCVEELKNLKSTSDYQTKFVKSVYNLLPKSSVPNSENLQKEVSEISCNSGIVKSNSKPIEPKLVDLTNEKSNENIENKSDKKKTEDKYKENSSVLDTKNVQKQVSKISCYE